MMLPQSIINAVSPIIFATVIARFDPSVALWLAAVAAFTGFASVLMLVRTCRS
jgi:hypothetical protein